jgi:hypothetical protein
MLCTGALVDWVIGYASFWHFPLRNLRVLLEERGLVRCTETGEDKPLGAVQGEIGEVTLVRSL